MAKEEKKKEEKAEKAPLTPEEEAAKGKKKKLILFGVIGLLVVGGGAAGAFMFIGKGGKPASENPGEATTAEGHADDATDTAEGEAHSKVEKDSHGEEKKDESADAKKDAHGEAKKDESGDAKKDAHGEPKKEGEEAAEAKKGEKSETPEYQGDFGLIKEFKPFHLNLGNPLENRYVRVVVGAEYKGGQEQQLELDRREPQLRDAIVSIIGRKTREHLLSPDGKDQLRLEIKNKLNQYLDKKIENIFITDILIE